MKTENIAILLVSPENPDNIGAVARAVKNMGFSDLRLVRPPRQWRTKAKKMAMSADDILNRDLFVIHQFQQRRIPFVMLLSGGYSQPSYRLVANTVARLLQKEEFSGSDNLESNNV